MNIKSESKYWKHNNAAERETKDFLFNICTFKHFIKNIVGMTIEQRTCVHV